jgi:hydrogenase expression/formation protein HypE
MKINISHGSGGTMTQQLIDGLFKRYFKSPLLHAGGDSAVFEASGRLAFTTDSYVVQPLFFPGGDIGRLAVCGTVNDLLTASVKPMYLSAAFILEEGLELETLESVVRSMAAAAGEAGVDIVTGDTKVVEGRGGLFVNTAGVGAVRGNVGAGPWRPGDAVLLSGSLGEHHAAILSRRMGIENGIQSDNAPLCGMVMELQNAGIELHAMRDVTRGGLGTILNEIAEASSSAIELNESSIPVNREVRGLCSILGLDPIYMGKEGKMVAIVPDTMAALAVQVMMNNRYGRNAAIIGHVADGKGLTLLTLLGGRRMLPPLNGEGLPRIC